MFVFFAKKRGGGTCQRRKCERRRKEKIWRVGVRVLVEKRDSEGERLPHQKKKRQTDRQTDCQASSKPASQRNKQTAIETDRQTN